MLVYTINYYALGYLRCSDVKILGWIFSLIDEKNSAWYMFNLSLETNFNFNQQTIPNFLQKISNLDTTLCGSKYAHFLVIFNVF